MLRRKRALTLPRLTDVTLTGADLSQAKPESVKRLYAALLELGVLAQIPAHLAGVLQSILVPDRTLLSAGMDSIRPSGFTGVLGDTNCPWQACVMKDCALDAEAFPEADAYRLPVDAALFLEDYGERFARFLARAPRPAMLCAQGETALATALSVCWLELGGASAAASLLGAGGYASLAEIAMALHLQGKSGLNLKALPEAARAWEALTGRAVPPYQPVLGARIFDVSSGVHVNGLLKDEESYEPFPPEAVGRERRIVLDQHSGLSAVTARLKALGIAPQTLDVQQLTRRVRARGLECGEVGEAAFAALVRQTQEGACA